jgi:hypothetical protein
MKVRVMQEDERGNIGIFILTRLLVALLVGFFIWGILPLAWKDELKAGPWGLVAVAGLGFMVLFAIAKGILDRREHKRAHVRVAKVFREAGDPALQKRAALWLIEHDRNQPERLADAGPALIEVLQRIMKSDTEKLDRARAANGLGVLGDPQAIGPLLGATKDEYPYVRAEAALALGKLRATQAEKRLRELVEDDWDPGVRGRAKEALERIGG